MTPADASGMPIVVGAVVEPAEPEPWGTVEAIIDGRVFVRLERGSLYSTDDPTELRVVPPEVKT